MRMLPFFSKSSGYSPNEMLVQPRRPDSHPVDGTSQNNLHQNSEWIPNKPVIIVKADDLMACNFRAFARLLEIMMPRELPMSIGIICSEIQAFNKYQKALICSSSDKVEYWHHGFDHTRKINPINPFRSNRYEFFNTPYMQQKENILRGIEVAKDFLGMTFSTFGPPYNFADRNTLKVLDEIDEIKIIFNKPYSPNKFMLSNMVKMESCTGKVRRAREFIQNFDRDKGASDLIVLQIHPDYWGKADYREFADIIDYLLNELNCRFMTPSSIYRSKMKTQAEKRRS